ncbi:MAG: arylsulfatase [Planctomycetaceae bacterium]
MTAFRVLPLLVLLFAMPVVRAGESPNVVIVIADDMGYGDLSCHGNKQLQTPNLDALYAESVRLTNFHVDPTCAPTRAALMTGKYSRRVGVWHTVMGRSLLAPEETTLAERFAGQGYRTAMFGKWHLGDNFPLRPQDQGFQEVLMHGGGGVGQTPDFWGNDYFDDVYLRNGHAERFKGYCTDVWFGEATKWLEDNGDEPFLLYLATNAPHAPYLVDERDSRPFQEAGIGGQRASFYGMITNLDENVGRFRKRIDELGLSENTIFIFMTDNGTAAGHRDGGFNAGMRGNKGSEYDGGHRVPCFIHWPASRVTGGRDLDALTAHIDLVPTLCSMAGFPIGIEEQLDGTDLSHWLRDEEDLPCAPPSPGDRTLVVESQRIDYPEKWRKCAVMTQRWRLVNGEELFDINEDPGQKRNVATEHPEIVKELRDAYERWWEHVSDRNGDYVRIVLGSEAAPVVHLTCHDWHPLSGDTDDVPWSQRDTVEQDPQANGFWAVDVEQPGRYAFRLRRRPAPDPATIDATTAAVRVDQDVATSTAESSVDARAASADLIVDLPAGSGDLWTELTSDDGETRGAYFVEVRLIEPFAAP